MSWTKQQLVEEAYGELALAGFVFDLQPEMLEAGLRRLDSMMATWNGQGIRLGYPLPSTPDASSLDQDSNLPDVATEAVYTNLAKRLAALHGKTLAPSTMLVAQEAYDTLLARAAMPQPFQPPNTLPRGAGNKPWRWQNGPFMPKPEDTIAAGPDSKFDFS